MKLQSSFTWGRRREAGIVAAALLVGGSLLGAQLASASGRSQPRAVTFPSYTATAINSATGIPTALNVTNSGAVVGYIFPDSGPFTAFIRTGTTLTPLAGLGTGDTFAFNANNAGDAVGDSKASPTAKAHAVFWRSSDRQHPVDLSGTLGVTDGESHALAINDAGDVVGVIGALGGSGSAFFLSHTGTVTIIGPGQANGVNNAANPQVAVMETTGADSQAGIWDAQNGFQPAPIAHSQGVRINDLGVLLGRSAAAAGGSMNNPFIWSAGQASVHPLGFTGRAGGINNAASPTVVGNDANGPVLWKEDSVVGLKSLLANANQVDVDNATGINDSGKISATGFSGSWLFSPGNATHVDLQATLTADPSSVASPTSTVSFTVSIKNFGPDSATGVQVTPVINGVTTSPVPVPGSIASGSTFESNFQIKPADFGVTGGTFIITGNVASDGIEPDPDTTHRNSSSTTVTVGSGTTTLTLQGVTVTPNPVQVPKPASVVLTFSGNLPTTGVNVTLQVTGVPVIGTYSKEFTGVHADAGKPKQATLTFDTSQLASVVTAPIQVHANAVYNGVRTNGPTVTINPAGPPPATPKPVGLSLEPSIKVKGFKVPAVLAPQPIQVTVKLAGKAPAALSVEGHLVVNGDDTSFSIPVAAGATTGTASVPTEKYLLMTGPASGRVTVKSGGVTYPTSSAANIVIFPLTLSKADYTVTPNGQSGGKVTALLTFSAPVPDAGVDVIFNGLFLNNKTVHVFPTASGSKTASVDLSTSEVIGYIKGDFTVKYNSTTLTSPLTVGVLAIQSISLDKSILDGSTGASATIQFNGKLDKSATVKLEFVGTSAKPINVKLKAGSSSYSYAIPLTVVKALVLLSPSGDTSYTIKASSTAVPGTPTFTFTVHKP